MRKALIVQGGWQGHEPREVAEVFRGMLEGEGFGVEVSDTLDAFRDEGKLMGMDLIVPIWTMGKILPEQLKPVVKAVSEGGVGMAGCHGGMCDAFRESTEWQFMTGGQWVAHPGNDTVRYKVCIKEREHEIVRGIGDFEITSEQYYMHVDPAVRVLATTEFPSPGVEGPHVPNGRVEMPQVWTKFYGKGRVFYSALGHHAKVFDVAGAREIMRRGMLWAAEKTR
ncbi:MAG TPA: ThuA domain-containing protein [Phycisphaerae bacterium]|nr:ThuA domain-containing protein [Phycisphaerae bacterium]